MRRCIDQSSGLALLSPFRSWLGCITNISGYNFRKGQVRLTDDDHLIQALAAQCVSAIGRLSRQSPGQNGYVERVIGTCGESFPAMRSITIKRARTWHYKKTRPCIVQSNGLAPLSPFRSWQGCIINTFGCDFRKGQVMVIKWIVYAWGAFGQIRCRIGLARRIHQFPKPSRGIVRL